MHDGERNATFGRSNNVVHILRNTGGTGAGFRECPATRHERGSSFNKCAPCTGSVLAQTRLPTSRTHLFADPFDPAGLYAFCTRITAPSFDGVVPIAVTTGRQDTIRVRTKRRRAYR